MRKVLSTVAVALAGLLLSSGTIEAQGGGGGGMRGGGARMNEMLFKGITLTDAQVASRDSIAKVFQAQMPAFTPGTPPSPEDRQKRQELMAKQNEAYKTLLNDEQKALFDKNLEEMRSQMRRPPPA